MTLEEKVGEWGYLVLPRKPYVGGSNRRITTQWLYQLLVRQYHAAGRRIRHYDGSSVFHLGHTTLSLHYDGSDSPLTVWIYGQPADVEQVMNMLVKRKPQVEYITRYEYELRKGNRKEGRT